MSKGCSTLEACADLGRVFVVVSSNLLKCSKQSRIGRKGMRTYLLVEDTIPLVDVRDIALVLVESLPGELVALVLPTIHKL